MFRADNVNSYFLYNYKKNCYGKLNPDADINTRDTYFAIFGPDQQQYIPDCIKIITKNNGVVLFQSKQSINFGYDDEPRNTLIIFEFNEVSV